jgi:mannose-6-phosphate isomerase-like protein (cupin superfamily)
MYVTRKDMLPSDGIAREFRGSDHGGLGISFLLVEAQPGQGPELHRHAYDEVIIVEEGRARFFVGDEERELGPGEIAVVPAGAPHRFVNVGDGPLRQVDIHLSPGFVTEWLNKG